MAENTGIFFVSRGIRGNLAQVQIVMGVWRLKYGDAVLGIQDLFYRVESLGCKAFLYAYAGEREKALRFDVDLAFFTFMRAYLFGMGAW